MEDIKFKHDKNTNSYWTSFSDKNISNKSSTIIFYEERNYLGYDLIYTIAFCIGTNRKQILKLAFNRRDYISNKITGNGSTKYLIFAYEAVIQFEEYIRSKYPTRKIALYISATDEKRWNVYSHYLKKIGYIEPECYKNMAFSRDMAMHKVIN